MYMKRISYITVIRVVLLISVSFYYGRITREYKKPLPEIQSFVFATSTLQEVTGTLYVAPFSSSQTYLNIIWNKWQDLDIQTYTFTDKILHQGFIDALKQGKTIHMMHENKPYQAFEDTYGEIQNFFSWYSWFYLTSDAHLPTEYLHSKITLTENSFIVQTSNLTKSSFGSNREFYFHSFNTGILKSLHTIFAHDWSGDALSVDDIHPNLLICPINCRSITENLIRNAQKSIWIYNQYITDPVIMKLLDQQVGLDLRMIVAKLDTNTPLLQHFGKKYARELAKPYVHAKMLLIDDRYLVVGSINYSPNALDNNREIAVIVTDPGVIEKFKERFEADW